MSAQDVIAEAIQPRRAKHGQLCPVWLKHARLADCDCWIKPSVQARASYAVMALREAGLLREEASGGPAE